MKQILWGGTGTPPNDSAVRYMCVEGQTAPSATINTRRNLVTEGGTLAYLRVESVAPGSGKSVTYTVMKNGVATALEVVIADLATSGEDTVNTVTFAAGDTMELRSTPSGTPTTDVTRWASQFDTTASARAIWGVQATDNLPQSDPGYFYPVGSNGAPTRSFPSTARDPVWNIDATLRSFYAELSVAPGVGKQYTLRIYKNGSVEASADLVISGLNTTGSVTGLAIDIAPGDVFSMNPVPNGTPAAAVATYGVSYEPDTDGQWNVSAWDSNAVGSSILYDSIHSGSYTSWSATENDRAVGARAANGAMSYKFASIRVKLDTAPGGIATRTLALSEDLSPSALTVTVTGAATTGVNAVDVDIDAAEARLALRHSVTGSPASSAVRIGLLAVGGSVPIAGASDAILGALTADGVATMAQASAAAALLSELTAAGVASEQQAATGAAALDALTAAGASQVPYVAAGASILAALVASGTGTRNAIGTGDVDLGELTALGYTAATIGAATLGLLTAAGQALVLMPPTGGDASPPASGGGGVGGNAGAGGADICLDIDLGIVNTTTGAVTLIQQPVQLRLKARRRVIKRTPSGYARATTLPGREAVIQWGESFLPVEDMAALRAYFAGRVNTVRWREPDGTVIQMRCRRDSFKTRWSWAQPGFYEPLVLTLTETA